MQATGTWRSRLGRRAVTLPALFAIAIVWTALTPLWAIATWLWDRLHPGDDALALATFGLVYAWCEVAGVLACAAISLAPPWGRARREAWLRRTLRLQVAWARALLGAAGALFGFTITLRFDEADDDPFAGSAPLLLVRHGSLTDTLLMPALVSHAYGHRFRYVMKRELAVDPCLDIVGHRLPNHFAERGSSDPQREIAAVVALLDDLRADEGVLIYPEGTRFSRAKHAAQIAALEERGRDGFAQRARRLRRTLLPRPGGAVGLLAANPGRDVVFVAHRGFEDSGSIARVARGALRDVRVELTAWRIPYDETPNRNAGDASDAERLDWLHAQWQRIDDWIVAREAEQETT